MGKRKVRKIKGGLNVSRFSSIFSDRHNSDAVLCRALLQEELMVCPMGVLELGQWAP